MSNELDLVFVQSKVGSPFGLGYGEDEGVLTINCDPTVVVVPDHPGRPGGERMVRAIFPFPCVTEGHRHFAKHFALEGEVWACECLIDRKFQWYVRPEVGHLLRTAGDLWVGIKTRGDLLVKRARLLISRFTCLYDVRIAKAGAQDQLKQIEDLLSVADKYICLQEPKDELPVVVETAVANLIGLAEAGMNIQTYTDDRALDRLVGIQRYSKDTVSDNLVEIQKYSPGRAEGKISRAAVDKLNQIPNINVIVYHDD